MNSRRPLGRTASSRPYVVALLGIATVRVTATGGGELSAYSLYFIEEPSIKTQGVIATHVTVRSPSAEYTATIPFWDELTDISLADTFALAETFISTAEASNAWFRDVFGDPDISTPAENTIERLVEIKEGNADTCQFVAEGLLERWGREQLSITGKVPLVVTLRFKELIKVVIPSANIDADYVLQRKEHNLSDFETSVTVGDLILSDDELLTRIIEELEG